MRATNADFRVTEVLSFEPSGEGEHEYLEIEKSGITTLEAAERLARALGSASRFFTDPGR